MEKKKKKSMIHGGTACLRAMPIVHNFIHGKAGFATAEGNIRPR
jgi:hypothetical protein